MKPTSPPATYSLRQLLTYWVAWMLGNVVSIYLSLYLSTLFIFFFWNIAVAIALGYLFTQLHRPHHAARIQLLSQLLFVAGIIISIAEGVYAMVFLWECFFYGGNCFGLEFYDFTGA